MLYNITGLIFHSSLLDLTLFQETTEEAVERGCFGVPTLFFSKGQEGKIQKIQTKSMVVQRNTNLEMIGDAINFVNYELITYRLIKINRKSFELLSRFQISMGSLYILLLNLYLKVTLLLYTIFLYIYLNITLPYMYCVADMLGKPQKKKFLHQ